MFEVSADAYDRLMGIYSAQLAPQLADFAGVHSGQKALDVGCGPGALTGELVARLGPDAVAAVDPSSAFAAAVRERHPGVDVHRSTAEELPFPDASFDAALAQLVVHFMADPVAGLREMGRVTRRDGVVAACVWVSQVSARRSPRSGKRPATSGTWKTSPNWQARVPATSPSCARLRVFTTSKRPSSLRV